MDFRTTLKHLGRLGEVNFEEFAEATDIPRHNASVYLSRLFKMGLVSRRKDKRYGKDYPRTPYRYRVSKKGDQYLKYEETTKTETKHPDDEKFKREYLRDKLRYYRLLRALKKETETKSEKIPCIINGFLLHLTPAEFREWAKLKEEQRIARKWDKYR